MLDPGYEIRITRQCTEDLRGEDGIDAAPSGHRDGHEADQILELRRRRAGRLAFRRGLGRVLRAERLNLIGGDLECRDADVVRAARRRGYAVDRLRGGEHDLPIGTSLACACFLE